MRYSAPTTVPSNLPSTSDETLSSDISLYWHLSFSTTAVFSAIRCRCGIAVAVYVAPSLQAFWAVLPFYLLSATAAKPTIHCRCGTTVHAAPSLQAFWAALSFRSSSTMAAKPAIRCRCGITVNVNVAPSLQAFWAALPFYLLSATAAKPANRCRCGIAVHAAPSLQAFCAALPFYLLSTTAAKPAIYCRCDCRCGRDFACPIALPVKYFTCPITFSGIIRNNTVSLRHVPAVLSVQILKT